MGIEIVNNQYSPVGDNITLILCLVLILLRNLTYSKKEIKLKVFSWAVNLLLIASSLRLCYFVIVKNFGYSHLTFYLINFYYLCLVFVFMNYSRYIIEIFGMQVKRRTLVGFLTTIVGSILMAWNVFIPLILSLFNSNYDIRNIEHCSLYNFYTTYAYHIILIAIILFRYKKIMMIKIWNSFVATAIISVFVVILSSCQNNVSFLTFTFLLPLLAAYNLLHNNPYNIELGTLDANAFENYLDELNEDEKDFTLLCLYFDDTSNREYMKDIRTEFYTTYEHIFRKAFLFKLNDKKFILVIRHQDFVGNLIEQYIHQLEKTLDILYNKYRIDYKITFITSHKVLNKTKNYISLNKYLEAKNPINSINFCEEKDINDFLRIKYIISELHDIAKKKNLNDERVLVYSQPVFNIHKQKYDSAEALMRLQLKDIGIVYPDIFIPLAEQEHCIHMLSLIILNKTCQQIKQLEKDGINITRISLNFSIMELRRKEFCKNITEIIKKNDISFDKIAIELTESKTEYDFLLIKNKIEELKKLGIYFYLDDFGTGYSNFDRIMQLPIDIIKFDRSLVLMSNQNQDYQYMIGNFSRTFEQLGYKILFEGIENKEDEEMCLQMNANYLQGYKYSKPIPIENLKDFLV